MATVRSMRWIAFAASLLMFGTVHAADNGDWLSLFDGKTLNGWHQLNGNAKFEVQDGCIVGASKIDEWNSFLATDRTFKDFILEFDIKQDGGPTNSGVQFRSLSDPKDRNGRVHGYQADVDPSDKEWSGGIYDEAGRGWLYPGTLNPIGDLYKYGEWNHYRIEAIGHSMRVWINGYPVSYIIDDVWPQGFIALQVHMIEKNKPEEQGRRTMWRNLRVLEQNLKPAPADPIFIRNAIPNDLDPAEAAQGWKLLWDGKTTRGWRSVNGGGFPKSGWKIENGELVVTGGGGDIITDDTFASFEMQLEFKLTKGANSGIMYFVTEASDPHHSAPLWLEYQLLDDENHPDAKQGVNGNRTLASLYDMIPRIQMRANVGIAPKVGEWQHARIVAHSDNRVEHWLNGVKVLEYTRGSREYRKLVANSKFKGYPLFGEAIRGHLLLQDHGDEVHFRSIKVRGF